MVESIPLLTLASASNFEEEAYLFANPDVREAVGKGTLKSGRWHFEKWGQADRRLILRASALRAAKKAKHDHISTILRAGATYVEAAQYFDCLSDELRSDARADQTSAISSNAYDPDTMELIESGGLFLDCGAGFRDEYWPNVVNLEIAAYASTDVVGIAEALPFIDASFDGVICHSVLEHVRRPWLAAQEIQRVLKPGGRLIVSAPFLAPLHSYPHHYFNMTKDGLATLFDEKIEVERHWVPNFQHPVWTLRWVLGSWANALPEGVRVQFRALTIGEVLDDTVGEALERPWCELPEKTKFEIACGTMMIGTKR